MSDYDTDFNTNNANSNDIAEADDVEPTESAADAAAAKFRELREGNLYPLTEDKEEEEKTERPLSDIEIKYQSYLDSEFSPDSQLPENVRLYPHYMGSRLAVITAKYLRDCGIYQENVDIKSLAEQIGMLSKNVDVRNNFSIDQDLSIHATALSGAFLALLEEKVEGENEIAKEKRIRVALQAQKQYRQLIYLTDILQSSRRKMKNRWEH